MGDISTEMPAYRLIEDGFGEEVINDLRIRITTLSRQVAELERTRERYKEMHVKMAERLCIRQDADGAVTDEIDRLQLQVAELEKARKAQEVFEASWMAQRAELEREKAEWGLLKKPSTQALEVFEKVLEHNPDADMKAVPNQWVLNERGIMAKVAADFEDQIAALQRRQITPELIDQIIEIAEIDDFDWEDTDPSARPRVTMLISDLRDHFKATGDQP